MPNVVEYGPDSVAVVLEWIHNPDNGVSHVHSVDAAPPIINMTSPTNASVYLHVLYNIIYNVSITFSLCGQKSATTSVILKISEFL